MVFPLDEMGFSFTEARKLAFRLPFVAARRAREAA
jgi:hypothetical protein